VFIIIVVYFIIDSIQKLLDTPLYDHSWYGKLLSFSVKSRYLINLSTCILHPKHLPQLPCPSWLSKWHDKVDHQQQMLLRFPLFRSVLGATPKVYDFVLCEHISKHHCYWICFSMLQPYTKKLFHLVHMFFFALC